MALDLRTAGHEDHDYPVPKLIARIRFLSPALLSEAGFSAAAAAYQRIADELHRLDKPGSSASADRATGVLAPTLLRGVERSGGKSGKRNDSASFTARRRPPTSAAWPPPSRQWGLEPETALSMLTEFAADVHRAAEIRYSYDHRDQERDLLIASMDELAPEDRRHVASLVESLRMASADRLGGGAAGGGLNAMETGMSNASQWGDATTGNGWGVGLTGFQGEACGAMDNASHWNC